jgi:hypothetical protein
LTQIPSHHYRSQMRQKQFDCAKVSVQFFFIVNLIKLCFILCHTCSGKVSWDVGPWNQGILKGGSITVPLTSCLTGLD